MHAWALRSWGPPGWLGPFRDRAQPGLESAGPSVQASHHPHGGHTLGKLHEHTLGKPWHKCTNCLYHHGQCEWRTLTSTNACMYIYSTVTQSPERSLPCTVLLLLHLYQIRTCAAARIYMCSRMYLLTLSEKAGVYTLEGGIVEISSSPLFRESYVSKHADTVTHTNIVICALCMPSCRRALATV